MFSKNTLIFYALLLVSILNLSIAKEVTFKGTVVDSDDRPVAGAKAVLYDIRYEDLEYSYNMEEAGEQTSNEDGEFSFTFEVETGQYSYKNIIVEKDGLTIDCVGWNVGNPETKAKFKLDTPIEMSGVIVDESGQPVSGSSVSILMIQDKILSDHNMNINVAPKLFNTISDEKGKFTFTNLPLDAGVEIIVNKKGRASVSSYISGAPASERYRYSPGQKNITIVQPKEARIEGVVKEKATGKPLAGIPLMLRGNNNYQIIGQDIIYSDENGKFSINGICAGTYNIICVPPRDEMAEWLAQPESFNLEAGQIVEDIQIELIKGGVLEVLITDAQNNKPLENASVTVYSEDTQQGIRSRSDKDGIAEIRLLPGAYQSAHAYRDGYSSLDLQNSLTIEEGRTKRIEMPLGPLPKASGVVRDGNGKALEGVKLSVLPGGGSRDVETDEEGKFEISWDIGWFGNESEVPLLVCRYEKENLAKVVILEGNTENLNIKLEPGITVTGKAANPEGNGILNAGIRMMLQSTMWASTFISGDTAKTDSEGNFEVKAIPAEYSYEIIVNADGYGSQRKNVHADDVVNNLLDTGTFNLPVANLSVSGIVVDTEGNPIPNARIESYNHEGGQPEQLNTQADSNGKFVLKGVCEGRIDLRVSANISEKRIAARAIAEGGTFDIRIIARERGEYVTQNFTNETYEQIIQESEIVIAGVVVDENDSPVSGVAVGVNCIKREREDVPGKYVWSFSSYNDLTGKSDEKGRFAITLKEDAQYDLIFSPHSYAAVLVYDIPSGKKDLKVVLPKGGTISGKLVRVEGDKKIPIPNVEVKLEQSDRASYTHLGFDQDQTKTTDSQGRFKFEHIQTKIRPHESMSKTEWQFIPRVWQLVYGDNTQTFAFYDKSVIDNFEFVIGHKLADSKQLKGNPLPEFDGIEIDFDKEKAKGKILLVCFFDIEQRPSRSCILQLSEKAAELKDKNIEVIAIHASAIEREYLDNWLKENNISFSVGMIETNEEQTKFNWGVRALPWLILTNKEHAVVSEGFGVNEIENEIKEQEK
ncbi:MAG: carboxypeptidase regulatory-like domain-containing protein [Sedimentisphaerales bacterium]|nr:carboxypeptidase regulatory-like domain-containing protein [Sedimentisphaerales bacterium]